MRIIHPRWYRPTPLAHGLTVGFLFDIYHQSTCIKMQAQYVSNYSTSGMVYPWRAIRDFLRIRPTSHSYNAFLKILHSDHQFIQFMMTSSNGNTFPRFWPFVRGIRRSQRPVTRIFDVFFDLSTPEQTVEQTIETRVI